MLLGQPHASAAIPLRKIPGGHKTGLDALKTTKISYLMDIKLQILWSSSLQPIQYAEYAVPAHGYGNSPCQKQNFLLFGLFQYALTIHLEVKFTLAQA
jgi:hypothetical protein